MMLQSKAVAIQQCQCQWQWWHLMMTVDDIHNVPKWWQWCTDDNGILPIGKATTTMVSQ